MTCTAEYHTHVEGRCLGGAVACDRPAGHLPSEWHRSRDEGIVWYFDRRHEAHVEVEVAA